MISAKHVKNILSLRSTGMIQKKGGMSLRYVESNKLLQISGHVRIAITCDNLTCMAREICPVTVLTSVVSAGYISDIKHEAERTNNS